MLRNKMKKVAVGAVAVAALTALCMGGVATSAQAEPNKGPEISVGGDTNWTIPDAPMTNVVKLGNSYYKVITTQTASNWVTAGPDWLGVSNSANLSNTSGTAQTAATSTMTGLWASSANQVPNAYNWNCFYNLYASAQGLDEVNLGIVNNGTSLDTESGVATGLKYRPEILWTDTLSQMQEYVDYIRNGEYYSKFPGSDTGDQGGSGGGRGQGGPSSVMPLADGDEGDGGGDEDTGTKVDDPAAYYAPYDEEYNPYEIGMGNGTTTNNPLAVSKLLYKMAWACEQTEAATANYNGMYDGKAVTDQYTDDSWKSMNALPRTTRYEASAENPMSARDCALAFEHVQKGAGWYILSQINEGKVKKKKVAFITSDFTEGTNTIGINAFDAYDSFNPASSSGGITNNAGFAGVAGPYLDQLVVGSYDVADSGNNVGGGRSIYCTATCDDLATCDVLVMTGVGGTNNSSDYTVDEWKNWMVAGCTTQKNKDAAENDVQYCVFSPTQPNAKNFSVDKSIYGIHVLDFCYPELFPNMELLTYYYSTLYHIKSANLKETMQWTLANTSLPNETSLSAISNNYTLDDAECKVAYGYEYYKNNASKDEVLKSLTNNKGVVSGEDLGTYDMLDDNGNAVEGETGTWSEIYYAPSNTYSDWYATYSKTDTYKKFIGTYKAPSTKKSSSAKKQTIKAKKKVTVKGSKKATVKVKKAKTKLAFKANKATKKALKIKAKGKKTLTIKATSKAKKGKTYTIKVFAKASSGYAKSNVVKIKVKVK